MICFANSENLLCNFDYVLTIPVRPEKWHISVARKQHRFCRQNLKMGLLPAFFESSIESRLENTGNRAFSMLLERY